MRKVKLAAIQPEAIWIPEKYSFRTEGYSEYPEKIIQDYIKKQLEITIGLLEAAGKAGCDIVTSCEDVSALADYGLDVTDENIFPQLVAMAEVLIKNAYSETAKKYSMYVVGCCLTREGGKNYNTAVIFDRRGQIIGEYRKTHLPFNEKWQCEAGDSLDVFQLDFGKIGVCICYDMMFPETVEVLALKGAEIIFHPTFGYGWYDEIGQATVKTRANDNGVYIVVSKNYTGSTTAKSSIVDFWGRTLAEAECCGNVIVTEIIDLDNEKKQPDGYFNAYLTGVNNVTQRLRRERRPELYRVICEGNENELQAPGLEEKLRLLDDIKAGKCRW